MINRNVQVNVTASGALLLQGHFSPHDDAHFKGHSWSHHPWEFRMADSGDQPTLIMHHFMFALLNESISDSISAIGIDNIVKTLACQDV